MAKMTAAQTTAELKRKASLGIAPTNSANQAQYNTIKASTPAKTTSSNSNTTKNISNDMNTFNNYKNSLTDRQTAAQKSGDKDLLGRIDAELTRINPIGQQYYNQGIGNSGIAQGSSGGAMNTPVETMEVNPNKYIEELAQMQINQQISSLQASRDSALSNLSAEKETIKPVFYEKRNQANVNMNNSARSFSEYMAQRGLQSSGVSSQGDLMNNMTYQSNIGNLNTAESNAFADIAKRQSDVSNNYESDLVSAKSGIEASKLQNLIAEYQRQDQLKRQDESMQYDRTQQSDALARQLEEQKRAREIETLGQYGDNYALEIQQRTAANPSDPYIPYLKMLRQQKVSGMATSQAEAEQQAFLNSIKSGELGLKQAGYNLDAMKTNYDISKPYYNPNSGGGGGTSGSGYLNKTDAVATYSEQFSNAIRADKISVAAAKQMLESNKQGIVDSYGISAYNQVWNKVLKAAIDAGQAEKK